MKLIALLLVLTPIAVYSQKEKAELATPKIEGLGPFKIGKTLCSKIPTFADTSKGRLFYAEPTTPGTELWFAGWYPISGIWVENLKLTFYRDTLYSIECSYSDSLKMALDIKFGKPKMKVQEKVVRCRTGAKIPFEEKEIVFYLTYPTIKKSIDAFALQGEYYDDDCQKQFVDAFIIKNSFLEDRIAVINAKNEKDRANSEKAKLKARLSNL